MTGFTSYCQGCVMVCVSGQLLWGRGWICFGWMNGPDMCDIQQIARANPHTPDTHISHKAEDGASHNEHQAQAKPPNSSNSRFTQVYCIRLVHTACWSLQWTSLRSFTSFGNHWQSFYQPGSFTWHQSRSCLQALSLHLRSVVTGTQSYSRITTDFQLQPEHKCQVNRI